MKALINASLLSFSLLLTSCIASPVFAHSGYAYPPMGSMIPTFEYLNDNKAKLVLKGSKVKKLMEFSDESSASVRYLPTVGRVSNVVSSQGKASYYWQGQRTANGEAFKPDGISCAHKTLPFNTRIRVTNLNNGKSVVCRVNDRGPFIAGRVVDLSRGAAKVIGMLGSGVVPVDIQVL
jgi:rare lipoprotein A (peptidoglycan hydrolase)